MPSTSWCSRYELLTRHGIDHKVAQSAAKNELRHWELNEIEAILKKVQRPSREYRYFRTPYVTISTEAVDLKRWWPSLWAENCPKWISPPREMMERSVREGAALCVNAEGQWSLRKSGYMALSHVWTEGLERNKIHDGLEKRKFDAIFSLLKGREIQADWVWADVLAIPAGGEPNMASKDDMLTTDIINMLPQIYSRADAVLIIDALVLQLHETDLVDVAVTLLCGTWKTRVWTFQEIKLAKRGLVVTAKSIYEYSELIKCLEDRQEKEPDRFLDLYQDLACLQKDDVRGPTITDIVLACGTRQSSQDIDYARAFFPVLNLDWEYGMTREQGMQKIYYSQPYNATQVMCLSGAPRMGIRPCWAPSYFNNLDGTMTEPMEWEERGVRGKLYAVKLRKVIDTYRHLGYLVLDLEVDCPGESSMQCGLAPNENEAVAEAFEAVIESGHGYVLFPIPFNASVGENWNEWATAALLVEQIVTENDSFEVVVHCATNIMSGSEHFEEQRAVLVRHDGPADGSLADKDH